MLGAIGGGGIAEAYYKHIPDSILRQIKKHSTRDLWGKAMAFYRHFGIKAIVEGAETPNEK